MIPYASLSRLPLFPAALGLCLAAAGCPVPENGSENGNGIDIPCEMITGVYAGPDAAAACLPFALQASSPGAGNEGEWTVLSGNDYQLSATDDPSASFSGTPGETYVLTWTVSNECGSESADVSINFDGHPTEADAGVDRVVAEQSLTLEANAPLVGSGVWSVLSGVGGSFSDTGDPAAVFTGGADETYELEWRISTSCYFTADTVSVAFVSPSPVTFTTIDSPIPLHLRVDPGAYLIRDAAEWVALGHNSAPTIETGTAHLLIFPGEYVFPGSRVEVEEILASHDQETWTIGVTVVQPDGCASYPLPAPAFALVRIAAPAADPGFLIEPTLVDEPCVGSIDNEWSCAVDAPCPEGFLCHGLTWTSPGFCRELDAALSFSFEGGTIPDDDPEGLMIPIEVSGLQSVPEDVQLELTVDHPSLADVVITLTNGAGSTATIRSYQPGPSGPFTRTYVVRGIPGDESVNGLWVLRIVDSGGGGGSLIGGVLGITSRWD